MRVDKLRHVFSALNQANVRYLVVGGIAVMAHGYQRLTTDVDIVIHLIPENVIAAMGSLTALGYRPKVPVRAVEFADQLKRESWIRENGMMVFQLVSDEYRWEPIDVFVQEPFPFDAVYARAHWHSLGAGVSIPIVPKRELCEMKRSAGRDKDLVDLRELGDYEAYEQGANPTG
ncbi:MAG: hypothetical protein WC205_17835 [Opitutaceae bacterium]|jgi:hypothetical protein